MPKKVIGVRLDEDTITRLEQRGRPSTVIRDLILESFKPPKVIEKKVVVEKIVEKEVIVEIPVLIDSSPQTFGQAWKMEIIEDVIRHEMSQGFAEWYIKRRIDLFEKEFNTKWRDKK